MRGLPGAQPSAKVVSELPPDLNEEKLLQQFLRLLDQASPSHDLREDDRYEPEVLFEVQVDQAHYTLTCTPSVPPKPQIHLSPRESEIVRLVAKGLPNKTIAAVLEISPWTVATHLRRVFGKLGVSTRAEMVACVLREGLIEAS